LLYNTVTTLLFEADPMGINFGDNADEYDPETSSILPRLASAKTADDIQTIVHEEFCRWFDPEGAGSRDRYRDVSRQFGKHGGNLRRKKMHQRKLKAA
jgi:hypothetical protein